MSPRDIQILNLLPNPYLIQCRNHKRGDRNDRSEGITPCTGAVRECHADTADQHRRQSRHGDRLAEDDIVENYECGRGEDLSELVETDGVGGQREVVEEEEEREERADGEELCER